MRSPDAKGGTTLLGRSLCKRASVLIVFALAGVACAANQTADDTTSPTPYPVATPDESAKPGEAIATLEHWADFATPMALRAPKNDDAWYVVERSGKVGGQLAETETRSVSDDGKTMTITTRGTREGAEYRSVQVFRRVSSE